MASFFLISFFRSLETKIALSLNDPPMQNGEKRSEVPQPPLLPPFNPRSAYTMADNSGPSALRAKNIAFVRAEAHAFALHLGDGT